MKIRKDKARARHLAQTPYERVLVPDWRNDPEKTAMDGELRDVIAGQLGLLSPQLRAAVVLRDVQGLSTKEAAEVLGVSIPNLKSRLHRGRLLLRRYLESCFIKPGD